MVEMRPRRLFTNYYKQVGAEMSGHGHHCERGGIMVMTTDERLDRLAVRHGALAESLRLLTADVQSLAQSVKEHDRILRGHADLVGDLVRIVAIHERRLEGVEGRS